MDSEMPVQLSKRTRAFAVRKCYTRPNPFRLKRTRLLVQKTDIRIIISVVHVLQRNSFHHFFWYIKPVSFLPSTCNKSTWFLHTSTPGVRHVWSETWENDPLTCAHNEDSNQPARMRRLIWVFVGRIKKLCILAIQKAPSEDCAVWSKSPPDAHVRGYVF